MSPASLDTSVLRLINQGLSTGVLDTLMVGATNMPLLLLLPFAAYVLIRQRDLALPLLVLSLVSLSLSDWAGMTLKELIARPRPFNAVEGINVLVGRGASFSMPSNHAANTFAAAVTFVLLARGWAPYAMLGGAAVVAFSRIYVGVHYPSDVLAGAALGAAVGAAVTALYGWARARDILEPATTRLLIFILAITLFRVYYIQMGPLDLSPDEAFYWEYSRRLGLSYYEKGPLIAYLIALSTAVFGNGAFGVRFLSVVFAAMTSLYVFKLGTETHGEKTGAFAAALIQVIPLFNAQGVLMTIDAPLMFFWALSLWLAHRAVSTGRPGYWLWLGAAVGMGMLAKYTMAFFFICALLYLLASKERRALLRTPWPWAGVATALAVFSPVLLWNASNGWVTVLHTAGHAGVGEGAGLSTEYLLNFLGSQLGVITPILLIMMVAALIQVRKTGSGDFYIWFSAPVLAFFVIKSLQSKVQANWAMPGYITACVAFCAIYLAKPGRFARWVRLASVVAIALAALVSAASFYPTALGLPPNLDPTARLRGWSELGREVTRLRDAMPNERVFIFSDRYQAAAELAFYVEGQPETYCVNFGRRMNQYDLWGMPGGLNGSDAIFVTMGDNDADPRLLAAFDSCEKHPLELREGARKLRSFSIFTCYGFSGEIAQDSPGSF